MGYANAQRMLNYIRIFAEFISQPEYVNVVPMFCIVNEALVGTIGKETLTSLCVAVFFVDIKLGRRAIISNLEVHQMIRGITGFGEGKGPYIAITDGIGGLTPWVGLLPNADRLALDTHTYFAFGGSPNTEPINVPAPDGQMGGVWPGKACTTWKDMMNSMYVTINLPFVSQKVYLPSQPNRFRCHYCWRIQQRLQ